MQDSLRIHRGHSVLQIALRISAFSRRFRRSNAGRGTVQVRRERAFNGREKLLHLDGLGDVIIHGGNQTAFTVASHGIGGQRNDGDMFVGRFLALASPFGNFSASSREF